MNQAVIEHERFGAERESALMPKTDAVCSLSSDSEHEAREGPATPKESQSHPAKKRKVSESVDKSSELYLRSLLGKQCSCSKKTCLQQFVEPALFERLKSYREHWFDLGKLDQDAFVPRPIFCIAFFKCLPLSSPSLQQVGNHTFLWFFPEPHSVNIPKHRRILFSKVMPQR